MNEKATYEGPEYPTQAHGSIPAFHSYEEEVAFWDTHSIADFTHETERVEFPYDHLAVIMTGDVI